MAPAAVILLTISLCWLGAGAAVFEGCYQDSGQDRVFIVSPGDYDPDLLATEVIACAAGCQALSYRYFGVWQARFCFCAQNISSAANATFRRTGSDAASCVDSEQIAVYSSENPGMADDLEIVPPGGGTIVSGFTATSLTANSSTMATIDYSVRMSYGDDASRWELLGDPQHRASKVYIMPGVRYAKANAYYQNTSLFGSSSLQLLVAEQLVNLSFTCPEVAAVNNPVYCTLQFSSGTRMRAAVNWGDGTLENFPLADLAWERAGTPVAQQSTGLVSATADNLVLVDADFKYPGVLQAFEFYGTSSAVVVNLMVFRPLCSASSQFCFGDYACSATSFCSSTIDCSTPVQTLCPATESCWRVSEPTCSKTMTKRNTTRGVAGAYQIAALYTSVSVSLGYNLYRVPSAFTVMPGDRIGFHGNSIAARALSSAEGRSYHMQKSTAPVLADTFEATNWNTSAVHHQLSAVSRLLPTYRLERKFSTIGNSTVTVSLTNEAFGGSATSLSQVVWLQEGINDTSFQPVTDVLNNEPCNLRLKPHTGVNVKYNWTFSDGGVDFTSVPVSAYIMTGLGPASVNVTAYNDVDIKWGTLNFNLVSWVVVSNITADGQPFGNDSAVHIVLSSGSSYLCTVNISNGESYGPTNSTLNFRVSALSKLGLYFVTGTCYNSLSSSSRTVPLYVEIPVTGFSLGTQAVEVGTPFQLVLGIANGSHPRFQVLIAGEQKSVVYDPFKLQALVEALNLSSVGVYSVVCRAYNNVSDILIVFNLTAQRRIAGATFSVVSSAIAVNGSATFDISLSAGTGITMNVQFGDGQSYNFTTSKLEESGGLHLVLNHTYTIGGSFTVILTISNLLNTTTLTVPVNVLAPLGQYALVGPPAASLNGLVQFSLQLLSGSPPSMASIAINWGDGSPLQTFPMLLTMTYNHTYAAVGSYVVTYNASNPIPSTASNSASISIVDHIVNPRAAFTPTVLAKGEAASVTVTIDGGSQITCTLAPGDGGPPVITTITTSGPNTQRTLTYTYNNNGTFLMNATICNTLQCFSYLHNLKVVNKLLSSTLPLTTNGNQTFGNPVIFTFSYGGAPADAPDGSMIEIRDASGTVVIVTQLVLPATQLPILPAQEGYISYTFFLYNNGSNFTIQSPKIGTFRPLVNLNVTLMYRSKTGSVLISGFGANRLSFPSKQDLVAVPWSPGYVDTYRFSVSPISPGGGQSVADFKANETIFLYLNTTGAYFVTLLASNPVSNGTFSVNITVGGSISNGRIVDSAGISLPGQTRSLSAVWDMLSEDTCVYVDLGLSTQRFVFGPAGCQSICSPADNKTYNHTGRVVTNNRVDFSVIYQKRGNYAVTVFTCNQFSNDTIAATAAVSPSQCRPPMVTMADESNMRVENPRKVLRSAPVTVECIITDLPCEATAQNKREWRIESLDEVSKSVTGSINVSSLPTFGNTILAIPPRFLQIGLYRITARVIMNMTVTVEEFANQSSMYLQVGSSPLKVSITPGGMIEVKRSVGRTICLEPNLNSFDPDVESSDPSSQGIGSWVYHCWQLGETEPNDASRTPVQTPRSGNFSAINFTTGCFSSPPGFVQTGGGSGAFCFNGANLMENRTYVFKVQGFKDTRFASSILRIITTKLFPANVDLRCRFPAECHRMSSSDLGYNMVNPTDTVQLTSSCQSAENDSVCESTAWSVEYLDGSSNWISVGSHAMQNFVQGSSNQEVSLSPDLFANVSSSRRFRVCLKVGMDTPNEGEACILLFTNQVPTAGVCTCNATSGIAGVTMFQIDCSPFIDSDGIESYQFVLKVKANATTNYTTLIGFSDKPVFQSTFPFVGSFVDLFVVATDGYGATTTVHISTIELSEPSSSYVNSQVQSILSGRSSISKTIYKGNLKDTSQAVQGLAAMIVAMSRSSIKSISGTESVTTAGSGYDEISLNGITQYKYQPIGGATRKLKALSKSARDAYERNRDQRAQVMSVLSGAFAFMTVANYEQIRLVANTMQVVTADTDDLSRTAQRNCKKKAMEAAKAVVALSVSLSKERLTELAMPVMATLAQTMTASSVHMTHGTLTDQRSAMATSYGDYDTDWESSRGGFLDQPVGQASRAFVVETNSVVQSQVASEVTSSCMSALTTLAYSMSSKLVLNDKPMYMKSSQLSLVLTKSDPTSMSGSKVRTGRSSVTLPTNLCQLTGRSKRRCTGSGSAVALTAMATPTNPYASAATNNGDCNVLTTSEVVTMSLADDNGTEIAVSDTGSSWFGLFLRKDPTFVEPNYTDPNPLQPIPQIPEPKEIPGTADGPFGKNRLAEQKLILHDFQLTGSDQSVHFQVRFENFTLGVTPCRQFLVVGRLWKAPSLTDASKGFDWWGMIPTHTRFCNETPGPSDPDPFIFFVTNAQFKEAKARVKKHASNWDRNVDKVKFGVRELSEAEWNRYDSLTRPTVPYPYSNQFTIKYTLRIFSASCYAITPGQSSWSTGGCTVGPLTTVSATHCMCTHLTSFAGGWVESPNTIDWDYVFSNFDFTKNPTLFITEIVIFVIFVAVFIWARHWDKKDLEKLGVTPLLDNNPDHKYLYEVVVSTGMRRGAGTNSNVFFILSGERDETDARHLMDKNRKVLQRGCVDRFLLAVERPLGSLNFLRLWHDNSGEGSAASWYCNSVAVIDLQSRRRYHFVVNRWMAVEEDDGAVDRVVPVAGNQELGDFSYMFSTHTKKRLTDGHLWLSIMARPPESRFTRVERVACCLMLLFMSMVTTCMFYQNEGPTKPAASDGLTIGPFILTPRMVFVGVVTNLISFLPLFLVMELFRRSRLRVGYINQLKKAINDHFDGDDGEIQAEQKGGAETATSSGALPGGPTLPASARQIDVSVNDDEKKLEKAVRFPWWVRIIAWAVLIISTAVSALFTTFYGIQFGDETCKKWISSLFISFFTSVMLSQPLKVLMMAAFMALLCKKSSVDEEEFMDDEEEVLNELGQRNGLRMDEEWLHDDGEVGMDGQRRSGIPPPNAELLERARERRLKEKKIFDILREIAFYFMFYFLLLFVTFSFRDPNAYNLKEQMERLILPDMGASSGEGIPGITKEDEFWSWLQTKFVPAIRAGPWYNNDPPLQQRGFTGDRVARLVGYAIMRQKRVRMDTCSVLPSVRYLVGHCVQTYSFSIEETGNFNPKWKAYDANTTAAKPQFEAFQHTSGEQLKNMGPYMARQYTYDTGGYVFQFRGSLKTIQDNINELKTFRWLDRQTRAVFLDLAFYNPNVNLFGVGTIVFELSGSGGMLGIYRFQAANLLSFLASGVKSFEIACQVLFCVMLVVMIIKEIRNLYKQRKEYFCNIWNIAELFILFGSVLSIASYGYVLYETSRLTAEFSKYGGNVYLNFQYLAFWNEYLTYFTGFIVFVSTLKFIRLLRFNKRIGMMGDVVRMAAKDIRQFFLMFFIIFCAFVQTFHLVFMQRLYGYSTFLYTMEQLMQIALGKFKFLDLCEAEPVLGPLIFATYTIFVIFILLNMFVSILNEAFAKVKSDVEKRENEYEMVDFMVQKVMMWVGLGQSRAARAYFGHNLANTDYRSQNLDEQLNVTLPNRIDSLLKFINKAYLKDIGGRGSAAKLQKAYRVESAEAEEPRRRKAVT